MVRHKHNLKPLELPKGYLDAIKSTCVCGKFFETNPYTGKVSEITKEEIDLRLRTFDDGYR